MPWLAKKSGTGEAMMVTPHIPGWPSTGCWTPMATFLATWAPPEVWPEIDDGAVVTPQTIETAMRGLPWKAASDSSHKALDHEVVALQSKMRELEKEVGTLQDAKVITQEVITTQAEWCHGLQDTVEWLIAHIANKWGGASERASGCMWWSGGILHVLALVDTGAEVTVLHSNINNKEATSQICGLGGNLTPALQAKVTLTIGNAMPFTTTTVLIAPIKEYSLGIDVLAGRTVETLNGCFCFGTLQAGFAIRSITVLRGFPKWDPVVLPVPTKVEEITQTIQALQQVGIVKETMTAFNNPIWPVRKPDGTWRMTVDYRELTKVTPPLAVTVPDMKKISKNLQPWKVVIDLANAFFLIAIASESQDQFAFTWQQKQYTFQVLPQGYKHMIAADVALWSGTITVYHYIDDLLIMAESQQEIETAAELVKIREIPNKVQQTVQRFPVPTTVKQLQAFLGLLGYWRTFIPHLAVLMRPLQKLTKKVDYTGPLPPSRGWRYVFTAADTVSGLFFAKPTKYANQHSTTEALEQLIHHYRPPHQIQSDQGTHLSGHNVQDRAQGLGVDWIFHIAYHPQANGLIERMNEMLKEQFKKLTSTKTLQHWSSHLTKAVGSACFVVLYYKHMPWIHFREINMCCFGDPPVGKESFGCVVANCFYQLLDDESDPFHILCDTE
ncbi:hypothetical protein QYF61_024291 [Mycteria americana]|uniref:ribonuclease H n=1 Tax=Mycteria americana TaxID=33587 RepID=A0AAN7N9H9_MYCAM|nr:hypothetical protein QYF61_024291 [Mycteria americana]